MKITKDDGYKGLKNAHLDPDTPFKFRLYVCSTGKPIPMSSTVPVQIPEIDNKGFWQCADPNCVNLDPEQHFYNEDLNADKTEQLTTKKLLYFVS